jgi:hypothetical protein
MLLPTTMKKSPTLLFMFHYPFPRHKATQNIQPSSESHFFSLDGFADLRL